MQRGLVESFFFFFPEHRGHAKEKEDVERRGISKSCREKETSEETKEVSE